MANHQHLIPVIKIVKRFVTELMQVQEYRVFVVGYQEKLLHLFRLHGEYEAHRYLDFDISDVYELLVQYQVPMVSSNELITQHYSIETSPDPITFFSGITNNS